MSFLQSVNNVAKVAGNVMNPVGAVADIGLGFLNYNRQKENLAYQKDMQQQAWAREDIATKRRVEDLKAAGLSPTLAAGSAAQSSGPIQTHAPQYDGGSVQQKAMDFLQQSQMRANIAQTQAQSALLDAQRKVLEYDFGVYSTVPGLTSKDSGTIPLASRAVLDLGNKLKSGLDKTDKDEKFLSNLIELSKPAESADLGEYKKNKGYSPDVDAWKNKLNEQFKFIKSEGPVFVDEVKKGIPQLVEQYKDWYKKDSDKALDIAIKRMFE